MNKSALIATSLTVLFVLGLVVYRLLWAASSVAAAAELGRVQKRVTALAFWRASNISMFPMDGVHRFSDWHAVAMR